MIKTVCVIGLGYIGLPTATMFASHGKKVIGVDIRQEVIDILNKGEIHINEPGLKERVKHVLVNKSLEVSTNVKPVDAFIIAVPTPFQHENFVSDEGIAYKKADMKFVISAAESILPHLQPGNLVILESTSPPRTTIDIVKPILEQTGLIAGKDFYLAYSPERVLPGKIMFELIENARVIGGVNEISARKGKELYSTFVKGEIVLTDATTAEMTKLMENTYRDVNIALANEFSRLSSRFGINVWEAIEIANRHPRVEILNPGPGVGGHCISVDPWFIIESALEDTPLIYTARQVNDSQPEFVVELVKQVLGELQGKKIAALGLAYKPNVDDFRESPSIEIVEKLLTLGCDVRAYDPFATAFHGLGSYLYSSIEEVIDQADLLLLLLDHSEFKSLSPEMFDSMKNKTVLDTRNCFDLKKWQDYGFEVVLLGDSK